MTTLHDMTHYHEWNGFFYEVTKRVRETKTHEFQQVKKNLLTIREKFPDKAAKIMETANQGVEGFQKQPGTGGKFMFVGKPPRWLANPVNDHEFVWQLSRMDHWVEYIAAFHLTDDPRYAHALVLELEDWIDRCPRPALAYDLPTGYYRFFAVNPWRACEVGNRMWKSWYHAFSFLILTGHMDARLLEKMVTSIYEHAEVLAIVSPIMDPGAKGNHFLLEMVALLYVCDMLPEIRCAEAWGKFAGEQLSRCLANQFTKHGGQHEGCPGYHNNCVWFMGQGAVMAAKLGLPFSDADLATLRKTMDYSVHASRANGKCVPWDDSNPNYGSAVSAFFGHKLFNEDTWLRHVARLAGPDILERELASLYMELGDADTSALCRGFKNTPDLPLHYWEKSLDHAMMRTAWDSDAISLFFACHSPPYNGHAHIGLLSFDLTGLGRNLVVDSGVLTYRQDDDSRYFKSTASHSTLMIDGKDQFEYIDSWAFGPQKEGRVTNVFEGANFIAAQGFHRNYEPAIHRRLIGIINKQFVIVWDVVENIEHSSRIDITFNVDSTTCHMDGSAVNTADPDANLFLKTTDGPAIELLPGRISEAKDTTRPCTRVRLTDASVQAKTKSYFTILFPYRGEKPVISDIMLDGHTARVAINGACHAFTWDGEKFTL